MTGTTHGPSSSDALALSIDDYDLERFGRVAAAFGTSRFGYVVTPNVDHVIRYHDEPAFRMLYRDASYVLMDSRFLARILAAWKGIELPVCAGSDLTPRLLQGAADGDRIVIVGGTRPQVSQLAERYGLKNLEHVEPPMGFIHNPFAVEKCLVQIEQASPFRYCFLAVGSPQQEVLARHLKLRGRARGLALCVGGAINFITQRERRAPLWMQRQGLEWLFRLSQDPRRLSGRYLLRGPRIVALIHKLTLQLRLAEPVTARRG